MKNMLLAIDIGNSNVVLGIHHDNEWWKVWRLPTLLEEEPLLFYQEQIHDLFLEEGISNKQIEQVIISCVVPDLLLPFQQLSVHFFNIQALSVGPEIYPDFPIKVRRPSELGTDLYANALAAHYLYGKDCIIIDFGTALTFTIVNKEGTIIGVNIAPGLKTAIHALFLKTAQLPEVPLRLPKSVVGKNTTHAIQSGILIGYIGLVRHMIAAIRAELGDSYMTIGTGGLVNVLEPLKEDFAFIEPHLTLNGLRIIGEAIKKTL